MIYYLDTDAIYNLKRIPDSILENSFYSLFSIVEMIAGLDKETFNKRKSTLKNILASPAKCDYCFPEELLFRSFDYFNDCDFVEERIEDLLGITNDILNSDDHDEFHSKIVFNERKYDFFYFVALDKQYTANFAGASIKGKALIDETLIKGGEPRITLGGTTYDLSTRRAIVNFLNAPNINTSFTILALASAATKFFVTSAEEVDIIEEKIYTSYNGTLDVFVKGFSKYAEIQTIDSSTPSRNDYQDLTHLYYLRRGENTKIVSNDKLFQKCAPGETVMISSLAD